MKIINTKEEYEDFFPYNKKYITQYPKEYPCICKIVDEERGIMGEDLVVYVTYYPTEETDIKKVFESGLKNKWVKL